MSMHISFCFFFQAEDGIRDRNVTGVQTCALPISLAAHVAFVSMIAVLGWRALTEPADVSDKAERLFVNGSVEIGRASCRERVEVLEVAGVLKRKRVGHWMAELRSDRSRYIWSCVG